MSLLVLAGSCTFRFFVPLFGLWSAAFIFLNNGKSDSLETVVVTSCLIAVLPLLVGLVAGVFLDKVAGVEGKSKLFAPILAAFSFYYVLDSGLILRLLGPLAALPKVTSGLSLANLVLNSISSVAFAGGLIALAISLAILAVELPLRWFASATLKSKILDLEALRPIAILLLLALSLTQITGVIEAYIGPKVLSQVGNP